MFGSKDIDLKRIILLKRTPSTGAEKAVRHRCEYKAGS